MKHILCFGDSNTHGSATEYDGRYDYDDRWTIILGKLLGPEYHVIEEGLGGRTTVFDDPFRPGKNGLKDISNILQTHKPLDLVIIMLGTNDTKQVYNASVKSIAHGAEVIIEKIRSEDMPQPGILLISPIRIGEGIDSSGFESYDYSSHQKSLEFPKWFRRTAEITGSYFFDAAAVAHAGSDCLHMTKESHRAFAEALCGIVRDILA